MSSLIKSVKSGALPACIVLFAVAALVAACGGVGSAEITPEPEPTTTPETDPTTEITTEIEPMDETATVVITEPAPTPAPTNEAICAPSSRLFTYNVIQITPTLEIYALRRTSETKIIESDGQNIYVYEEGRYSSSRVQLLDRYYHDREPVWSPDCTQIAFASDRGSKKKLELDIFVMNADGTNVRQLTDIGGSGYSLLSWSPDGSKIAFQAKRSNDWRYYDIFVINSDGTGLTQATDTASRKSYAVFSSDGSKIAFNSGKHTFVVNSDGSDFRQLTNNPQTEGVVSWTPDDAHIVITRIVGFTSRHGFEIDLLAVRTDGTGIKLIADDGPVPNWWSLNSSAP